MRCGAEATGWGWMGGRLQPVSHHSKPRDEHLPQWNAVSVSVEGLRTLMMGLQHWGHSWVALMLPRVLLMLPGSAGGSSYCSEHLVLAQDWSLEVLGQREGQGVDWVIGQKN